MINKIKTWWVSNYRVITLERAKEMDLEFVTNIYGDRINFLNCRSIWKDKNDTPYRCESLFLEPEVESC